MPKTTSNMSFRCRLDVVLDVVFRNDMLAKSYTRLKRCDVYSLKYFFGVFRYSSYTVNSKRLDIMFGFYVKVQQQLRT